MIVLSDPNRVEPGPTGLNQMKLISMLPYHTSPVQGFLDDLGFWIIFNGHDQFGSVHPESNGFRIVLKILDMSLLFLNIMKVFFFTSIFLEIINITFEI